MFASRTNWRLETNRLARALDEHRKSGRQLLDLTASNPTECGLQYPAQEILAALSNPRTLAYRPDSKGLPEAREAVAAYYAGRVGFSASSSPTLRVDPERILLASGTSEAYTHIFRLLCEPGDEILVPARGAHAAFARRYGRASEQSHRLFCEAARSDPISSDLRGAGNGNRRR